MQDIINVHFKFKVSDILQPIIAPDVKLIVLERNYRECSGGNQIFYYCGLSMRISDYSTRYTNATKSQVFNEIELEEWKEEKKKGDINNPSVNDE